MKKKFFALVLLSLFVMGICGCGTTDDENLFIMADVQEAGHPTAESCDRFAQLVKERTNGRVVIEVYHGSTLGVEADQVQQVAVGGIDFARVSTSPASSFYSDLKAFQALYLFKNDEQMWRVLDGEIGDSMLNAQELRDNGIIGLCWFSGGSRNFYNNQKEIHSPSDLSGLTLRVNTDSMFALLSNCNSTGINIAYNDILSSIKAGIIDGAENNWPSYISTEHYTEAQYITIDGHTRIPEMIIASSAAKERMTGEDWNIVLQCAEEVSQYQRQAMADYDAEAIGTAEKAGCTITELTDSELEEFRGAAEPVNKEISADYMDIIERIQAVD